MGGGIPLGLRVEKRRLIVDDTEATIVRYLFDRYLELRSVRALVEDANAKGFPGRSAQTGSDANNVDSREPTLRRFGRGPLYYLLSNPIYVGKVRHRDEVHEGAHDAIIDDDTFAKVQALLATQGHMRSSATNSADLHPLTGLLFDESGARMRSVHTT